MDVFVGVGLTELSEFAPLQDEKNYCKIFIMSHFKTLEINQRHRTR